MPEITGYLVLVGLWVFMHVLRYFLYRVGCFFWDMDNPVQIGDTLVGSEAGWEEESGQASPGLQAGPARIR